MKLLQLMVSEQNEIMWGFELNALYFPHWNFQFQFTCKYFVLVVRHIVCHCIVCIQTRVNLNIFNMP